MKFSEIAKKSGEDERMIQMLIWLITAAGKEKQRQILDRKNVFVQEEITPEELRNNLLSLTQEVAGSYSEYGEGFNATKLARGIEFDLLQANLPLDRGLAIDLGCANGCMSNFLAGEGFSKINGYDVSPDMIREAEKGKTSNKVSYEVTDLFEGFPEQDDCVDLVVANFGSASEINNNLIGEINRVLRKGGKAFLSFYNKKSLMDNWWQPWQSSMETVINPENDFIEVPIIRKDGTHKVFRVYAKAKSYEDIVSDLQGTELQVDGTYSHSFITSMMPPIFFDDEDRVKQVMEYEKNHCKHKPYLGHYLVFVLSK